MRLVTFVRDGAPRLGAFTDADRAIVDLARLGGTSEFATMQAFIEAGVSVWAQARELVDDPPRSSIVTRSAVRLLAPLPRPVQLRDFASFEAHSSNAGRIQLPPVWYAQPVYYKCNRLSVVGDDVEVSWPAGSRMIDYELELAAVIGTGGSRIGREDADRHIFGYTIFNDLSARDWQFEEMEVGLGPSRGKDFDGGNVLGPCIVTSDEITDPYQLTMIARVNGEEWSRNSSCTIHHRFDRMIEHISEAQTIHPGEILGSGTVGGGCGAELGRYLQRGDEVELEIEGIGILRTRIA